MPRILIMHASVGAGHVSAAQALAEAFARKQAGEVRIEDIFDYGSQVFREAVTQDDPGDPPLSEGRSPPFRRGGGFTRAASSLIASVRQRSCRPKEATITMLSVSRCPVSNRCRRTARRTSRSSGGSKTRHPTSGCATS